MKPYLAAVKATTAFGIERVNDMLDVPADAEWISGVGNFIRAARGLDDGEEIYFGGDLDEIALIDDEFGIR